MKNLLLLAVIIFSFVPVFSQSRRISGIVTAQDSTPLSGATISIKGTTKSVVSDANGAFTIDMTGSKANTLTVTYVGYHPADININNRSVINVTLQKEETALTDVVVVGYGTQKRKDITGSVVSIDSQRLQNLPNSNFAQALEGSLPGVSVNTNGGGAEGSSVSILIRGRKSVLASRNPIIILDGIPYNGSFSDINPSDIASMEILKDASASAIYGSRAANGVILLTTKRGTSAKPVISYDGFTGVQQIANLPPVLLGEDFYNFKVTREGIGAVTLSERAIYNSKNFTNWLDLATRKGMRSQHTLSIRGGSSNIKYYGSLSYLDVKGVAVNDHFQRFSSRINLEATITSWLTYGTNTQLSYNDRSGLPATFAGDYGAYRFNPLTTPFDSLGNPTIYPWPEDRFFANPLAPTLAKSRDNTYKALTTNYLQVKIPFVKGLSYRLNTGMDYQGRTINTYYGRNTRTGSQNNGSLSQTNSIVRNVTLENIMYYNRSFNKHNIDLTGLYSYEYRNTVSNTLSAEGFPSDILTFYQANVALFKDPRTSYQKETLIGQMARLNYNYDSRYLLTLTARRDGYSGFGENHKFGFFPIVAVGWNITNEHFFSNSKVVNNLKLRLSYGSVGNQAVGPYETLAKLSTRSYVEGNQTAAGYIPTSLGNPDLRWETSTQGNIGIDFAILNNRVSGTMDIYDTKTRDLLLTRQISPVQGIPTVTQNIGKTSNHGFELGVNSINIRIKDFTWSTNANFTINRNKWADVYGDGKDDTASRYFIGHPIGSDFGYVFNGVYQLNVDTVNTPQGKVSPGFTKIRDINGDGIINQYDRTIISTGQPDFTWGMGNTFKYKNLNLYIFVHGIQGRHDPNSLMSDAVDAGVRHTTIYKNWWTPTNPSNDFPANAIGVSKGLPVSIVQNSSFVRVKDILLSYNFSGRLLEKTKFSRLKIFLETRNPFTFTKWTGLDPEFTTQTEIPLEKEYVIGLNLSL
jgi:TonB-linked SusC/RagA family outer membrane protein